MFNLSFLCYNFIMLKENIDNYLPKDNSWLIPRKNGMLLSDYQIEVLQNNNLNYLDYKSINELLFAINNVLNDDYDEYLDEIASMIDESNYYQNTNK